VDGVIGAGEFRLDDEFEEIESAVQQVPAAPSF
jgi:hypothetical protein